METTDLTVKTSIFEQEDYLLERINETIINKSKLHITAPVGTHKTTLAMELINLYPDYQFLFLMPQISISTQVYNKLDSEKTPAFIFNSKTKRDLEDWEDENQHYWPETYLSTIDSARRLFEEGKLDLDKTVVIVDETHAFLQNPRKDFDPTVLAIKESGCPVIGFTATESTWVLKYVLGTDEVIRINATDLPSKRIVPIKVGRGMPATTAQLIQDSGWNKVVIWTNNITDQERIEKEIKLNLPEQKVLVLNAKTRDTSEQQSWNHLMQNYKIPLRVDILIANSIAQAGININDKNIDAVLLVGQFDPLGFQQYLGRCRNYSGYYYFLHLNYGKGTIKWPGTDKMEAYLAHVQKILDNYSEEEFDSLSEINPLLADYYTQLPDGKIILKKCMVANLAYKSFREVNGTEMLDFVGEIDETLIIEDEIEDPGVQSQNSSAQKAGYRRTKKAELPKLVKKDAKYLKSIIAFHQERMDYDDLLELIEDSAPFVSKAKRDKLLYVPKTFKTKLVKTVETAKNAGVSVQRLLLAAKKYIDNGKDEKTLKALLNMSNKKVQKIVDAYFFFLNDCQDTPAIVAVMNKFSEQITEKEEAGEWKKQIQAHFNNIPGSGSIAQKIYSSCFITKGVKVMVNGTRKNRRELVQVVDTFQDYLKGNNLTSIF